MKSIILTNAPINETEQKLLKKTAIFKLALNHHGESLNPNLRIISDYNLADICSNFPQKVVSIREKFRYDSEKVEYTNIKFKGSTIVAAVEYLILKNYDEILLVADNTVYTLDFKNKVKEEIDKLKNKARIFQYSNGNFNLPVISIKKFIKKGQKNGKNIKN